MKTKHINKYENNSINRLTILLNILNILKNKQMLNNDDKQNKHTIKYENII